MSNFLSNMFFYVILSLIWLCCFRGTKSFWDAPACSHVCLMTSLFHAVTWGTKGPFKNYITPEGWGGYREVLHGVTEGEGGKVICYITFSLSANFNFLPFVPLFCALGVAKGYTTQGGYYLFLHFNNKHILMARGVA